MTAGGHVGPRWPIGRAPEASVLASAWQRRQAEEEDFRDLGIRAAGRHRLYRRIAAYLDAARHERRYERRDHLDGAVTDISAGIGRVATPTAHLDAALGRGEAENRAPAGAPLQPLAAGRNAGPASPGLRLGQRGHAALGLEAGSA